jgi:hypothetical protein
MPMSRTVSPLDTSTVSPSATDTTATVTVVVCSGSPIAVVGCAGSASAAGVRSVAGGPSE